MKNSDSSSQVIIFSHYGYSSYLEYTLACARKTNSNSRLIFLGDEKNRLVAEKYGWEHYCFSNYKGLMQDRFNEVFRHVQGKKHTHMKNGQDWLRYVFERWFYIDGFIKSESIQRFWHFDTDTMIMMDLNEHEKALSQYDFTVQCNGTCLNGIIDAEVVSEFCRHICKLFEDVDFIRFQQDEFNNKNPQFAFTEMRAFDDYKKHTPRNWLHLMNYRDDIIFDDALCQSHGFDVVHLPIGRTIKDIWASNGGIYGRRNNQEVLFITLNLSWLPDMVFDWALRSHGLNARLADDLTWPLYYKLRGFIRKLRSR